MNCTDKHRYKDSQCNPQVKVPTVTFHFQKYHVLHTALPCDAQPLPAADCSYDKETTSSSCVFLSCIRGTVELWIHTILLQKIKMSNWFYPRKKYQLMIFNRFNCWESSFSNTVERIQPETFGSECVALRKWVTVDSYFSCVVGRQINEPWLLFHSQVHCEKCTEAITVSG